MDFPCPLWLVYVLVPWRVIEDCHSRSGSSMNVGLEVSLEPCEVRAKMGNSTNRTEKFLLATGKTWYSGLLYI